MIQAKQTCDKDDSTAEMRADLEQLISEQSLCGRALCIPGWIWRKIAVREPVSSKLQVAGVCVSLRDYGHVLPDLQEDLTAEHISNRNAAQDVRNNMKASDLQPSRSRQQQGQPPMGPGASELPQKRQPAISIVPAVVPGINPIMAHVITPTTAPGFDRPSSPHTTTAEQSPVTHTLLRQWGAEVFVTILPVGWTKTKDDEMSGPGPQQVVAPGQPYHLQTRGLAKLNSIWEGPEGSQGSGDEGTPTHSGFKSLFAGHPSVQRSAVVQKNVMSGKREPVRHESGSPESPGPGFPHRQSNPLCRRLLDSVLTATELTCSC